MEFDRDKNELLKHFENLLSHDRLKARVFSITQLGLVELTRKRARQDLKSILTRNCPVCGDNGWIMKEENISCCTIHGDKIQADRIKAISEFSSGKKSVLIATDVARDRKSTRLNSSH